MKRIAAALRGLGVGKGDRITIYMPTCPESIVLMLATVRIGAIHSVVFAGFGAQALGDRIAASGSRVVFTADVTYRKGKDVPLQGDRRRRARRPAADRSSASSSSQRGGAPAPDGAHLRGTTSCAAATARLGPLR